MNPDYLFTRPPGVFEQCIVPVTSIVPGRWQPRRRFDEQKLNELADSIREFGVLTRLKVFCNEKGEYELIAGERRWRACKIAGLAVVHVEIVEWMARQIQEVSIIDNLQRDDLSPEDEGAAFELAIKQLNVSEADLAKRMGKGRTYIQQRRKLAGAAPELRAALTEGTVTFSIVRGILAGAGASHDFQKWGLGIVLKKIKDGHRVREKEARWATSDKILGDCKEALIKLGWTVRQAWLPAIGGNRWTIYSRSDLPTQWPGQKVYDVLINEEEPEDTFMADELAPISLTATESHTTRLRNVTTIHHLCPPYTRILFGGKKEWMNGTELKMFLGRLGVEIDQRVLDFNKHDLDLRVSKFDFNLYQNGVPTAHTALDWSQTGELLEKLDTGEIEIEGRYPEELKEVGASKPQEYMDTCVLCDAEGRPYEFYFVDKAWQKLCPTCKKIEIKKVKAETKEIRGVIKKELTPLLEGATSKQLLLIQHLIWRASGAQIKEDEIIDKWSKLLWDDDGIISIRKKVIKKDLKL